MKNIYKYLIEKLVISKNLKGSLINKYQSLYGNGEIKQFKDSGVYTLNSYGHKNEKIEDPKIYDFINKYFDDDEYVFIISEEYKNNRILKRSLNQKTLTAIFANSPLDYIVRLSKLGRGYYIKNIPDDQVVLLVKDFLRNGSLRYVKYIFKIK